MIQIGRYEELGSGVRKVNHYLPLYAPGAGKPIFEDGDMFTVSLPLSVEPGARSGARLEAQSGARSVAIMRALQSAPHSANELVVRLSLRSKTGALKRSLRELLNNDLIEYTIPDKPASRLQKYRLTDKGRALLGRQKDNKI